MAHIHKQLTVQNGDMIDPEDFNGDLRELAGEYNGMLDRDNFQEHTFNYLDIAPNTFNKIYSFTFQNLTISRSTTSFQNGLMTYTFEAQSDGTLICEWSGDLHFVGPDSHIGFTSTTCQFATLQMSINGNVVGEVQRTSGGSYRHPVYMVGAAPIASGRVVVSINGRTASMGHTDRKMNLALADVNSPNNELVMIHRKR